MGVVRVMTAHESTAAGVTVNLAELGAHYVQVSAEAGPGNKFTISELYEIGGQTNRLLSRAQNFGSPDWSRARFGIPLSGVQFDMQWQTGRELSYHLTFHDTVLPTYGSLAIVVVSKSVAAGAQEEEMTTDDLGHFNHGYALVRCSGPMETTLRSDEQGTHYGEVRVIIPGLRGGSRWVGPFSFSRELTLRQRNLDAQNATTGEFILYGVF